MPKHKSGGKITTNHTSLTDAALSIVEAAEKLPEVDKISLGIIKQVGKSRGPRKLKFLPIVGGWKLTVRGSTSVQQIYIYTAQADKTKSVLEAMFS
ncbi:MAG: hypothetical protein BZY75_03630 [SAR202 cluster bacterium Io17-Chloro-G7]|nr:MAG: hypothetical protein BZY75_03630 [SAR202 cluster bacterium Io17-Chloro-G7]